MLRCAIYARVSDESQVRGESIDHQISFCREIARRRGLDDGEEWLLPESLVFVDAGVTGTSLVKREAVQELIREAKKKSFDVVLFKGISRFARDTVDALLMLRTMVASGVRVISIEENFDSYRDSAEFVFTIHSALAQAESEKTAVRVRMGAAQKAKQGKWNGQAPEGYLLNTQTQRLEPDFPYARLIQEIFALYLQGYGVRKIASSLNERGQRTRKGNLWSQRTIARILCNPVYVGDVVYGRRERRLTAPPTHEESLSRRKRTVWVENADDVIVCQNAHPSLVDRTVFESVQAVMATKRQFPGRSGGLHLLSRGIAKCQCGSSLTVRYNTAGTRYYRCVAQSDKGRSSCRQPFLRADQLESLVLSQFREDALQRFSFEVPKAVYNNPSSMARELQETEACRKKLIRSSQLLFEQFAEGCVSKEQFTTINDDYRERIAALSQRREKLLEIKNASWQECNESTLREAFAQLVSPESKNLEVTRQLLETCIENVTVTNYNITIQYRFAKDG